LDQSSEHADLFESPLRLAEYLAAVENGRPYEHLDAGSGVGTLGGSEDHTAILCSKKGQIGQFSYVPTRLERQIEIPDDIVFVVASSGVVARKTGEARDAYNRLSLLAEAASDLCCRVTGRPAANLARIIAGRPDRYEQLKRILGSSEHPEFETRDLLERCRQFYEESETIVAPAGAALARRDWAEFGRLTQHSQDLAERFLSNQTEETSFLVRAARDQGAIASSAFGAGFGGSVWALVDATEADSLIARWASAYRDRFPERYEMAQFFATQPSTGAREMFDGA
jgi:galactokinase